MMARAPARGRHGMREQDEYNQKTVCRNNARRRAFYGLATAGGFI
jgi:hypothetical protein